ncbi:MAG: gamma carbonic anhydrase family protein [Gammaproteobacteria bacterium]|nr:gamma carbonic anhydrase family protein [Gammaproteobacteria bacterium]MDE2349683.1 gamma carbonic anhydrase family protein [Gammaproteobacteria bacterium]
MNLRTHLGFEPRVGERVYIDESAVVIGRVVLGDDCSVWPFAVLRGDVQRIEIGARTNVQDGCVLHVVHDGPHSPGGLALSVGDDVTIGHKAVLHAATIGNRCLVGIGAVVLDGAVVPDETIIGAGSLVPPGKRLAARGLYLGNPARRIRDLEEAEIERLVYGARHYVRVKDEYRAARAAAADR